MSRPDLEVRDGGLGDVRETTPELFELITRMGHEEVVLNYDPSCDYRSIIAVHDTTLGPALGGTRFWKYDSDMDALIDALRLSRGMTYKAAVAGLNLGGGKAVIIDTDIRDREMLMRAHGRAIERLGGRYITAEDVGVSVEDMDFVHMETEHVVGMKGRSGDPSPVTAYGVFRGIQACALKRYGNESLEGKRVVVQGAGHVGYHVCRYLVEDGAKVFVSDIDEAKTARASEDLGAEVVPPEDVFAIDAEIFAPCALGAVINDETLPLLKVDIVAGAANNQLATAEHDTRLGERGILYAPDYVINAGGLINVYSELAGWSLERAKRKAGEIFSVLLDIFDLAEKEGITSGEAADRVAEERLRRVGRLHGRTHS